MKVELNQRTKEIVEEYYRSYLKNKVITFDDINDILGNYIINEAMYYYYFNKINKNKINNSDGFVYILTDATGLYKIGYTKSIHDRMINFKIGNTSIIIKELYIGNMNDEKALHIKFCKSCVQGEWFKLSELDFEYIHNYFFNKTY